MSAGNAKFLNGDLMRHILMMVSNSSIGLLTVFIVDFVDLYFIALLGDTSLTAAVGYAGTLIFFNLSIGIGLMIAMSALSSRRIGAEDEEGARQIGINIVALALIIGCIIGLIMFIAAPSLLGLIGASGEAQKAGAEYLRIISFSVPIMITGMAFNGMLNSRGDAPRVMRANVAGAVINAVLDPILIFGLGLDLKGAAIASVAARIVTTAMTFYPLLVKHGGFARFEVPKFIKDFSLITSIAVPAVLANIATPIGMLIITRYIAEYGDDAAAGLAVINRITPLAFCVVFAISGAVGPIIGQNFGAGQYDRVRGTIRKAVIFMTYYIAGVWLILPLSAGFISSNFNLGPDGRELLWVFALIATPLFFFNGVTFIANASFNNLNRPIWSTLFNWARNTIGTLPFVILGGHIAGAPGVIIGPAIGGIVFSVWALWLGFHVVGLFENGKEDPALPWRPKFLSFSRS